MPELEDALVQISTIRRQIARASVFRGYGPATVGATALLAAGGGLIQAVWITDPRGDLESYLALWVGIAVICALLVACEAVGRVRRIHSGIGQAMVYEAIEQLLPAFFAGAVLTGIIAFRSPEVGWMLPGLWQILFALGVFASVRSLPNGVFAIGLWYLASGLLCLGLTRDAHALSPWAMAVPFTIGQLLSAVVLSREIGEAK